MPDSIKVANAKTRPWWKIRRIRGLILGGTAAVIATIPGAPAIVTIGAFSITTVTVATLLGLIATGVYGYGAGAKVEREK